MYSNSNQGNFGSYSSNPQFAQNPFAQNFQQQQQPQQMAQQQQQQQQQQQAPPSAGGGGGYMNVPMAPQQQQQRPFTQYAAYGQYPNGPFRGNVNSSSGNYGGNRNDPDYKWDKPFIKDFLDTPRSWNKIDKQVDKMFSDVAKATQFKTLLRESGAKGVANMIDKFNFYGKAAERSEDGDVSARPP